MGFFEAILTTLTFGQIMILILSLLAASSLIGFGIFKLLMRNNYTVTFDGQGRKVRVSKKESLNVMLLFEALKIKDDIYRLEDVAHATIKKKVKEKLPKTQEIYLNMFKNLLCSEDIPVGSIEYQQIAIGNRDFLYYSLLVEKMYSSSFSYIMGAIEENGLNNKQNIHSYVTKKSEEIFTQSKNTTDSLFAGILDVDKSEHDLELLKIKPLLSEVYSSIFQDAITITKNEYKKKEEMKNALYEKIRSIEGMSHYQIENLFSEIDASSFLGVD